MGDGTKVTRRSFIKGVTATGALLSMGGMALTESGCSVEGTSQVFRVEDGRQGTAVDGPIVLHCLRRVSTHAQCFSAELFELFQTTQTTTNRAKVGQCTAQPAFADVGHSTTKRFAFHRFRGLTFRANDAEALSADWPLALKRPEFDTARAEDFDALLTGGHR